MGLDQYAAIRLDTKDEEGNWNQEELAYWRKHPHLQGFRILTRLRLVSRAKNCRKRVDSSLVTILVTIIKSLI